MNRKNSLKTKKTFFLVLLILIIILPAFISFISLNRGESANNYNSIDNPIVMSQGAGEEQWWNYSWQYRVPINLTSTSGDLSDYQVELHLNLTEWYEEGYLDASGKDIRFVNSSNDELGYWIQNIDVSGGESTIWVRVPTISGTEKIYMYFGNPEAEDVSSIDNTMDSGLRYFYYSGNNFQTYRGTDTYEDVDFNWGNGIVVINSENSWEDLDNYVSIRWEGWIANEGEGLHTFYVYTDDGSRLYINESRIIDTWIPQSPHEHSGTYSFSSVVPLKYEWYENAGGAVSRLGWDPVIGGKTYPIPTDHLWNRKYSEIEPSFSVGNIEYAELKVTCVDIDGFRVPNAQVYISNNSEPFLNQNASTNKYGEITFDNIPTGVYNITVDYTQNGIIGGKTQTVSYLEDYHKLEHELVVQTNLWTINFNATDYDGDSLNYGFVELYNQSEIVGNVSLNDGLATIRWINQSAYNYSVYFDSTKLPKGSIYHKNHLLVNSGSVSRTYPDKPKYTQESKNVDDFSYIKVIDVNYVEANEEFSADSGNYISQFSIGISGVVDYITKFAVRVQYAGELSWTSVHNNEFTALDNKNAYSFEYNYTKNIEKIELILEKHDSSGANGSVSLVYVESTDVNVGMNLSKVDFNVTEWGSGNPIENALVKVYNSTGNPTSETPVAMISADESGLARFYGFNNKVGEWGNYTVLIEFYGANYDFDVEDITYGKNEGYNITLDSQSFYNLKVRLNIENFQTDLNLISVNPSNFTSDIYWSDNITINLNFTTTINETTNLATPGSINMRFRDAGWSPYGPTIDLSGYEQESGIFDATLNTSEVNLKGGNSYYIIITAEKTGYISPDALLIPLYVKEIPTNISIYDYETSEPLESKKIEQYYGEVINVSLGYFNTRENALLIAEMFTYEWDYGFGNAVEDPENPGYYYISINTSLADAAEYRIELSVSKENFESKEDYFNLKILERPTTINGEKQIQDIPEIWIFQAKNFTFEYKDNLTGNRISGVQTAYYEWYSTTDQGIGDLVENEDSLYVLDFDTETRELGEYSIWIYIKKDNYELRVGHYTLKIQKRIIETTDLPNKKTNIIQGDSLIIRITLRDPTNESQLLTNANVTLNIDGTSYNLDEIQTGIYEYQFTTGEINAFFIPITLSAELDIEKGQYYEKETYEFSIIVGMTEIFPGFPMFYFLLIVIGVVAIVGALATYRYIQIARIPEFVKRARAMKKEIKGNKSISDKNLYPSKEEYIAEMFGEDWEKLGFSLGDKLGLQGNNDKKLNKSKEGGVY
ncbi:MAG: DUF2341 domain-containing protein [Promethearchaeota archaeon]|nr:MAG: DUF2341 domain-containing protein [Candidatus Lokiarchaeota archaeon]